jgi:hypothetical protein
MSSIVETILNVALKIFGLRSELAKARQQRKQEVSDFLSAVAQTIEDTSASLSQGIYPQGKCQELLCHSKNMEAAIGDLVGKKATELGNQLEEVYDIERLYSELNSKTDSEPERSQNVLDQAAGLFRATAAFVRVSP